MAKRQFLIRSAGVSALLFALFAATGCTREVDSITAASGKATATVYNSDPGATGSQTTWIELSKDDKKVTVARFPHLSPKQLKLHWADETHLQIEFPEEFRPEHKVVRSQGVEIAFVPFGEKRPCRRTVFERTTSPGGGWRAVSYQVDCGKAPVLTHVAVSSAFRFTDTDTLEDGQIVGTFSGMFEKPEELRLKWRDKSTLLIQHDTRAQVDFAASKYLDVKIEVEARSVEQAAEHGPK